MDNVEMTYIDVPGKVKYKRRLYVGCRNKWPALNSFLHSGSNKTIRENVDEVGLFPCLLVWDKTDGEKHYAEINRSAEKIS